MVDDGTYDSTGTKLNSTADGKIDYYIADVITANDYYPFGMMQPGRKFSNGSSYRYGFDSQEKDNEVYGAGNLNTAEFWEYDSRIGRRWNVDPKGVASESPYSCFSNNPIINIDIHGDKDSTVTTPNGGTITLPDGAKITGVHNSNKGGIDGVYNKDGTKALINVVPGSVYRFEFDGAVYNSYYDIGTATFLGYVKDDLGVPTLTPGNSFILEQHMEFAKPSTKEAGKIFKAGMGATVATSEAPPVAAATAATTTVVSGIVFLTSSLIIVTIAHDLKLTIPTLSVGGYFLDMASQRGKNNGKMDPDEIARIGAKIAAGTASALELQKWKRHLKNTKERPSRQSKN